MPLGLRIKGVQRSSEALFLDMRPPFETPTGGESTVETASEAVARRQLALALLNGPAAPFVWRLKGCEWAAECGNNTESHKRMAVTASQKFHPDYAIGD